MLGLDILTLALSLLTVTSSLAIIDVAASPAKRYIPHSTLESRAIVPSGWSLSSKRSVLPPRSLVLPMRFNLLQRNLHKAEQLLMSVSSPDSHNYGNHLSPNQVSDFFAPTQESVHSVLAWLQDAGFGTRAKYSKAIGAVTVDMTVAEAEQLLHTTYQVYTHPHAAKPHIACNSYSVPDAVLPHIDFITPTLHFDVPLGTRPPTPVTPDPSLEKRVPPSQKHTVQDGVAKAIGQPANSLNSSSTAGPKTNGFFKNIFNQLSKCDVQITPACLEALYKFSPSLQFSSKKNSFGIVEYTPQSYIPSDIDVFAKNFTPRAIGYRPKLASIDGGVVIDPSENGGPNFNLNGESNLDLQYAIALTHPLDITLYQVGDTVEGASFNNFLNGIDAKYCTYDGGNDPTQDGIYPDPYGGYQGAEDCGKYKPTNVISTSYAYNEADLTPRYETRQCNEYLKLGLLGVTVLYSSGDYGVAGNSDQCLTPDGTYSSGPDGTVFNPSFPSTCPWITSVGATQVNPNSTVYDPESACEQVIYSGGGFSNVFPIPSYQSDAVKAYFENHKPAYTAAQYNNSGVTRGFPDISANGANYLVSVGGLYYRVFGTSASSPVVGSIISLLNDARLNIGKPPIGFINPILYKYPHALNDITSGGNQGCGTPGFTAVPGWDPVTGLGTPNYPKLLAALLIN